MGRIRVERRRSPGVFLTTRLFAAAFSLTLGFSEAEAQAVFGPGGESLYFDNGGSFDLNNANLTVTGIFGGGTAQINLGSGTLTVAGTDPNSASYFGGTISGTGGLAISGLGNLVLAGPSTYSGGTILNSALLSISDDAQLGDPRGVLTLNGGTLVIAAGTTLTRSTVLGSSNSAIRAGSLTSPTATTVSLAGPITGPGALNLTDVGGSAGFIISGSNNYLGGTTISGASVTVTSDTALGASRTPVDIHSDGYGIGGVLMLGGSFSTDRNISLSDCYCGIGVTAGNTATVSGVIQGGSGAGGYPIYGIPVGLFVAGPGTLVLTGVNTYIGGTEIERGTLAINSDANLGAPGTRVFLNSYSGSTLQFLDDTTLQHPIGVGYDAEGILDTNGHNVTLASPISSQEGYLSKVGIGTLNLTGDNNMLIETQVKTGTLALGSVGTPAQLTGEVIVSPDATFSGNGEISRGVFFAGGNYAPMQGIANSGTVLVPAPTARLSIQGPYTQFASGTLAVRVAPSGGGGLVTTGAAALAGTLRILPDLGSYTAGTSIRVLDATGGISGSFASATATIPNFTFDLVQTSEQVSITFPQNTFAGLEPIGTGNRAAAVSALNGAFTPSVDPSFVADYTALMALPQPAQQQALSQISGVAHTSVPSVALAGAQQSNTLLLDHVLGADTIGASQALPAAPAHIAFGSAGAAMARLIAVATPSPLNAGPKEHARSSGLWIEGASSWGSVSGDASAPGSKSTGEGVMFGYDHAVGPDLLVGAAVGYSGAAINQDDGGGRTNVESWRGALYGGYQVGSLTFAGTISYAFDHFNTDRNVVPLGVSANSAHGGGEFNVSTEASYRLRAGDLEMAPFVRADFVRLTQHGFSENGAGALDLSIVPETFSSFQPEVGARFSDLFRFTNGNTLRPELTIGLRREFLDVGTNVGAALTGASSTNGFTTHGLSADRTIGDLGFRVSLQRIESVAFYVGADARVSGSASDESIGLGVRAFF